MANSFNIPHQNLMKFWGFSNPPTQTSSNSSSPPSTATSSSFASGSSTNSSHRSHPHNHHQHHPNHPSPRQTPYSFLHPLTATSSAPSPQSHNNKLLHPHHGVQQQHQNTNRFSDPFPRQYFDATKAQAHARINPHQGQTSSSSSSSSRRAAIDLSRSEGNNVGGGDESTRPMTAEEFVAVTESILNSGSHSNSGDPTSSGSIIPPAPDEVMSFVETSSPPSRQSSVLDLAAILGISTGGPGDSSGGGSSSSRSGGGGFGGSSGGFETGGGIGGGGAGSSGLTGGSGGQGGASGSGSSGSGFGGVAGTGGATQHPCLQCWATGQECYWIGGLSCGPCSATGVACNPAPPVSLVGSPQTSATTSAPLFSSPPPQHATAFGAFDPTQQILPPEVVMAMAEQMPQVPQQQQQHHQPDNSRPGADVVRALASELIDDAYRVMPATWREAGQGCVLGDLRESFEQCQRDMRRMGPVGEALCGIYMAIGARVSTHSAIVSTEARPAPPPLQGDLSTFGLLREQPCRILLSQACRLVDASGALEKPTYRSISLLCALLQVLNYRDPDTASRYVEIAVQHLRTMFKAQRKAGVRPYTPAFELPIVMILARLDAHLHFDMRRMPIMSEDDLLAAMSQSGLPEELFINPDWLAKRDLDEVITGGNLPFVYQAGYLATLRMMAVASCSSTGTLSHTSFSKLIEIVKAQRAAFGRMATLAMRRPDAQNSEVESHLDENVYSPDDGIFGQALARLHYLLYDRMPESSLLVPLYNDTETLLGQHLRKVANYAKKIIESPPSTTSEKAFHCMAFMNVFDYVRNGMGHLATYVEQRDGRRVDERRFDADAMLQMAASLAYFNQDWYAHLERGRAAMKEVDARLGKVFPSGYQRD